MEKPIEEMTPGTGGCLLRLYWMFFGNVVLLFLTVFIIDRHVQLPSWYDLAFLINLITLLIVRYIDIHYLHGQTGDGKPASARDFRNYAITIIAVSALVWALTCVIR